jgi:hypothetical protein
LIQFLVTRSVCVKKELMPYLAWTKGNDELRFSEHQRLGSQLVIRLNPSEREELLRELGALLEFRSRELRIEISCGWTIFCKLRDSESRSLLAHPDPGNWVATLAFDVPDLKRVLSALENPNGPFSLCQTIALGGLSNLELILES